MIYIATYIRKLKDRNGNYITPATRSKGVYFSSNQTLDDLVFPIGFIYQSTSSTSPASLYGGSWERIQGRFLLGTSSSYSVSSTGGEAEHTLSIDEMPIHRHYKEAYHYYQDNTGEVVAGYITGTTVGINESIRVAHNNYTGGVLDPDTYEDVNGDQPHNNMPPYYAVNIWRRTA